MSQSSAILTLHRRTGGDTEGGRAIARQTPRARGAPRLLRGERGVTARASRPGPASKLPSLGRRGLAEALRAPRGGDGACLFLKSGSACRRLEPGRRPKAAARGGKRTADAGARAGAGLQGPVEHHELGRVDEPKSHPTKSKEEPTVLSPCA